MKLLKIFATILLLPVLVFTTNNAPQITIDVAKPGAPVCSTMVGIFFEDINFGADGGLYPELVKNRSFEFDRPLRGWQVIPAKNNNGRVLNLRDENRPRNPRFLRILSGDSDGLGLVNEGFRGMGIRQGNKYRFSIYARRVEGNIDTVRVQILDNNGQILAQGQIHGFSKDWNKYQCLLTATATVEKAKMNLRFVGTGTLDVDLVSLFPLNTWNNRENGLRTDIVQLLADLKPGFLRFPGGCIVEGFDLSQRYQWKNTIGNPDERILNINRWNFEFKHRLTPDYYQTYGLGYYEFFQLAEDLNAEPMPILNCGMACQFNSAELVPMDQLHPYVQDALDLIEFANGSVSSEWGRIRAAMGHPKPFNMKMIGIGNEQWGSQYIERYKRFAAAIKEKYPEMQLIAATGSDATIFPNGQAEIDFLWDQWRKLEPEIVDEHFYRTPEWFIENVNYYDQYDRNGPKLFVGEYAAQSVGVGSPDNRNTWKCALFEAAFMTGLERNADLVTMSCYAPLFAHKDAWQWRPDLIWFDNLTAFGSANYQVQKLFSLYKGTRQLTATTANIPQLNQKAGTLFASATLDENEGTVLIKVVNVSDKNLSVGLDLKGVTKITGDARIVQLISDSLEAENTFEEPDKIVPIERTQSIAAPEFNLEFPHYSLTVIQIPVK